MDPRMAKTVFLLTLCLTLNVDIARAQIDHVANCKREVQGTKIWMSSTIGGHRKGLSAKLNDVDIPLYCECYHSKLREALGEDLYQRSRSYSGEMSTQELLKTGEEDRRAVISCVESQVTSQSGSAGSTAAFQQIPHQDKYLAFLRGIVSPAGGIGGLRPGDSKAKMFEVLGPTKTFKSLPDGKEEYYYGPNSTEVVVTVSPPPAETIRKIAVNYRFQGQTSGGGRIGDSREKIKRSYPGKLATDLLIVAVYCDGTTFAFVDGRLVSIRVADLESDVFKSDRIRNCPK